MILSPSGSQLERFEFIRAFFTSEWESLDRKIKSIVISELTRIIGGFSEPKFKKVFCPRPEDIVFKGFDGESVIGPAKIFLKPYWKERGGSYFEEEGE